MYDIRIFGCEAYVLDEKSLKAHPKAFRCIYLGPSDTHKGCIFYNLYTKKIIFSRNFILNEQCVPGKTYFPNIYDRYFGSTPPFDISDLAFSTQQPTTASNLDFNNIPYSNLFHFKTNANMMIRIPIVIIILMRRSNVMILMNEKNILAVTKILNIMMMMTILILPPLMIQMIQMIIMIMLMLVLNKLMFLIEMYLVK